MESRISSTILEGIGRIVIQWSQVEELCAHLVERMLGAHPGSVYVITPGISNSTVVQWIRVLATGLYPDQDDFDHVNDALTELDELRAERNAFIHGLWEFGSESDAATVSTTRLDRREITVTRLVTLAELDELSVQIADLTDKLIHIMASLDPAYAGSNDP